MVRAYTIDNLTEFFYVLEDENNYMLRLATMQEIPDVVNKAAHNELCLLQNISRITPDTVKKLAGIDLELAEWNVSELNFIKIYAERMSQLQTKGYGIFAKYHAFVLKDGVIAPVKAPDNQKLSQLEGYENERRKVIDNSCTAQWKACRNALLTATALASRRQLPANEYMIWGFV